MWSKNPVVAKTRLCVFVVRLCVLSVEINGTAVSAKFLGLLAFSFGLH